MLLVGSYNCQLDGNNRFRMHKKLKNEFPQNERLFITKEDENCLVIFTETQYIEELRKIKYGNFDKATKDKYSRLLTKNSGLIDFDEQGRATLPEDLKISVGINKDLTLIGVFDRVEVWDSTKWKEYNESMSDNEMFEGLNKLNV